MKICFTFCFTFLASFLIACSCFGPPTFCEVINAEEMFLTEGYIVMAKKLNDVDHGMDIEILESYGKELEGEVIRVWGDPGWLCRIYTSGFGIGDTLFLNLLKVGEFSPMDQEDPEDYQVSFCGIHHLVVQDGMVIGQIDEAETQTVSVDLFRSHLQNNTCLSASVKDEPVEFQSIEIGPNPVISDLVITASSQLQRIDLFSLDGELIITRDHIGALTYLLDNLVCAQGIYVVRVTGINEEIYTGKIVKF